MLYHLLFFCELRYMLMTKKKKKGKKAFKLNSRKGKQRETKILSWQHSFVNPSQTYLDFFFILEGFLLSSY